MEIPSDTLCGSGGTRPALDLARVLVVHGELAPRLALQTILQAGGYAVDVAASPQEALSKLDEKQYDLVLSEPEVGARSAGRKVLAYARVKGYRPATALINSYHARESEPPKTTRHQISVYTENLPNLLTAVAELIGIRATRRNNRSLRHAI